MRTRIFLINTRSIRIQTTSRGGLASIRIRAMRIVCGRAQCAFDPHSMRIRSVVWTGLILSMLPQSIPNLHDIVHVPSILVHAQAHLHLHDIVH